MKDSSKRSSAAGGGSSVRTTGRLDRSERRVAEDDDEEGDEVPGEHLAVDVRHSVVFRVGHLSVEVDERVNDRLEHPETTQRGHELTHKFPETTQRARPCIDAQVPRNHTASS